MYQILKIITIVGAVLVFLVNSTPTVAAINIGDIFGQGTFQKEGGIADSYSTLSELYNPIIWNAYVAAGLISFLVLLGGGFLFIMGAGQADGKKIAQSKQAITWGFVGFLVIFSSFWIIQIIKILTGVDILGGDTTF